MLTVDAGIKSLQGFGAKITSQRIAIMESLEGRSDHPSAEQLFIELKRDHPTMSIATIYSTAQLLAQASMLRILSINDKKVYFDPDTRPHAHFMCRKCKKIIDLDVEFNLLAILKPESGIDSIDYSEVFHYGLCAKCVKGKKRINH
jgi:Fur family peroxide stress response transcriptional regulator